MLTTSAEKLRVNDYTAIFKKILIFSKNLKRGKTETLSTKYITIIIDLPI